MKLKNYLIIIFSLFLLCRLYSPSYAQHFVERDYLVNALNNEPVKNYIANIESWREENKISLLKKIAGLPDEVKNKVIKNADEAISYDWPALPATLYLDYKQTGNRSRFQDKESERQKMLNYLVIGELVARNKKYLPQIVNGLWVMLEESTWVLPAHVVSQKAGSGLPDPGEEIIDLGSGRTAATLAVIQNMLHDELQQFSPVVNKRIQFELRKRIIDPYLQRDDYWWMGFKGQSVNNWNAWINTNVLQTALLSQKSMDTLALVINKIFRSADNFINQYPDDGGCDEGPSYWSEAGGKLIRLLHLMNSVSGGELSWEGNTLLHNMGSYIYKVHIAGNYFVNFADANAKTIPNPESVYRFGVMFNDDSLTHFAAYLFNLKKKEIPVANVVDFLGTLDVYDQLSTLSPAATLPAFSCLPFLEVATARSNAGSDKGLFLAVQGGHNGESHNHNDVGNFIIYADGQPVIIDAGVGTYTAQTFSNKRYELWNMQSQWHNCPTINRVMQQAGKQFKALDFLCTADKKNEVKVKMDIAKAYPAVASVKRWEREFLFNQKKNTIDLSENYTLDKWAGGIKINFLSSCEIKKESNGVIGFYNVEGKKVLVLKYKYGNLLPVIEEKILVDKRLISSWGSKLYRLTFEITNKSLRGKTNFEFSR